jgi:hypothetical protein
VIAMSVSVRGYWVSILEVIDFVLRCFLCGGMTLFYGVVLYGETGLFLF